MIVPFFTQLTSDPLDGPNLNPINSAAWLTIGGLPGTDQLEILNGVCVTTVQVQGDGTAQNVAISWPANQFFSLQIEELGDNGTVFIYLRGGSGIVPCYRLTITGSIGTAPGSFFYIVDAVGGTSQSPSVDYTWADFAPLEFTPGDVFTFAVHGQTNGHLFVYQNGFLIFEGALNLNPVEIIASGQPGFQLASESSPLLQSDAEAINFIGGSVTAGQTNAIGFAPSWFFDQQSSGLGIYVATGQANGFQTNGAFVPVPANATTYVWATGNCVVQTGPSLPDNVYPIAIVVSGPVVTSGNTEAGFGGFKVNNGILSIMDIRAGLV